MQSLNLGTIISGAGTITDYFVLISLALFGLVAIWLVIGAGRDLASMAEERRSGPGQVSAFAPGVKVFIATCMFYLPQVIGLTWGQLFSTSTPEQNLGEQASGAGTTTYCLAASSGGATESNPVECMITNLANNVAPGAATFICVLAGAAGLWMVWSFLKATLDKVSYSDARMKLPWGSLAVGILFAGIAAVVVAFGSTLGLTSGDITENGYTSNAAFLAYIPDSSGMPTQFKNMLVAAYAIFAVFGLGAVVRGGFILADMMNGTGPSGGGRKAAMHIMFGVGCIFMPHIMIAIARSAGVLQS